MRDKRTAYNYTTIVNRLCEVANKPNLITDIDDFVDTRSGKARLKYKINGSDLNWDIEINNDWANTLMLSYTMDDIECDGCRFYFKENGQAIILFYLDEAAANEINKLSNNTLKPFIPK
ncbi:hypothetical protein [Leptothoe kymatousa]|uniref:Uncharacterized protein n=1 Tax=Leptothoe kymatousa TAU-MAC 1615 TaxID=2364775 RepID=A0ABS5Y4A6_9CYAN|nr:hypothetical protein [Leptothoe kymatousa]MBT9312668.1 hypothetical protein [Leptothoe kymatousa TAU-MAC 1615]